MYKQNPSLFINNMIFWIIWKSSYLSTTLVSSSLSKKLLCLIGPIYWLSPFYNIFYFLITLFLFKYNSCPFTMPLLSWFNPFKRLSFQIEPSFSNKHKSSVFIQLFVSFWKSNFLLNHFLFKHLFFLVQFLLLNETLFSWNFSFSYNFLFNPTLSLSLSLASKTLHKSQFFFPAWTFSNPALPNSSKSFLVKHVPVEWSSFFWYNPSFFKESLRER